MICSFMNERQGPFFSGLGVCLSACLSVRYKSSEWTFQKMFCNWDASFFCDLCLKTKFNFNIPKWLKEGKEEEGERKKNDLTIFIYFLYF